MTAESSVWMVLRHRAFRALWAAGLISMIGTWMQSLGAAWLMTELSPAPIMVGMVQAAQSMPGLFLGPITGALVDMFDRRRFLMTVMAWQIGVTLLLSVLTFLGVVTPWILVGCIFSVGVGNACQGPAMSANLQEIVPREEITGAVTLNAMALNISRAIGPAMAGVLIGITGEGAAFLVNSACYAGYLATVAKKVPMREPTWSGPSQGFWESMAGGFRYARRAKRFQAVMIRGFSYFLGASASIALLPVMARRELHVGPERFGTLLAFIGLGAIITGFGLMNYFNRRFSRDHVSLAAALVIAATLVVIAWSRTYWVIAATLVIFGGAWMIGMISIQIATQMVLPAWVRGRGISLGMMSSSAGLALGQIGWGAVANHMSLRTTYMIASVVLTAIALYTARFKISGMEPEEV